VKQMNPVYLDYNATTPIDPEVAEEMIPYIKSHFGNPSSSYPIGRFSKEAMIRSRAQVAGLINADPGEIIFTSCATEANNLAIRGIAQKNKGKHMITSSIEHPAVIEVCRYLETQGFEVTYLPVDHSGIVNPDDVKSAIRQDTTLISIMHANNETGSIQPISGIAAIAKQKNILFHTDAAQSAGKIEVDVKKSGIDLLTIAGHKLYAPKGIGALCIRQGVKIENILYGANQEKGIRPGTENIIHIVGLGKACEIAKRDFKKNQQIMFSTRDALLNGLKNKLGDRINVNGDLNNGLPNTLSIAFDGVEAHTLSSLINDEVYLSTGSACHADSIEISPVLKAMNIDLKRAAGTVRISTGKYTTREEIDYAVEMISGAVLKLS